MIPYIFTGLLSIGAVVAATTENIAPELHVITSIGTVNGIYNDSASTVRAFLGVRYAEPPTGALRFAPPRPKSSTDSPINASSFGGPCPQVYDRDMQSIYGVLPFQIWNPEQMTEDCLSVNIWTPSEKRQGKKGAAVMLYIHGGAFDHGSGSAQFFDGTNLVRDHEDVILVTLNYRLDVFGFPNSPGLGLSEQNVGLLDQRLAVEWVHQNIANFGGDPDRILLFGQSAGAVSVDTYSYAYPDNPLVSALALHSGTASLMKNTDQAHHNWNQLSTVVGCGVGPETLSCMREVPWEKIINAIKAGNYSFTPVPDNRTFFSDYTVRAREGRHARLPMLAGITAREMVSSYPLDQPSVNETQILSAVYDSFSCPLYEVMQNRLEQNLRTWRYVYHGNFTNLSPTPWLGAYHSSELPLVFGTYNIPELSPPSASEIAVSEYMQGAWVAFARDHQNGLRKYGWPRFRFDRNSLVNLVLDNIPGAIISDADEWDSHCDGASMRN